MILNDLKFWKINSSGIFTEPYPGMETNFGHFFGRLFEPVEANLRYKKGVWGWWGGGGYLCQICHPKYFLKLK